MAVSLTTMKIYLDWVINLAMFAWCLIQDFVPPTGVCVIAG